MVSMCSIAVGHALSLGLKPYGCQRMSEASSMHALFGRVKEANSLVGVPWIEELCQLF